MSNTEQIDAGRLSAPEPADPHWLMLAAHQMYMSQVKRDEPDWYDRYDASDVMRASEALALAQDAPSEYCAGLLTGRWLLLKEIEALTERTTD